MTNNTRAAILAEYNVDENSRITNPGKFEGEMLYAPYFYEVALHGVSEELDDDGEYVTLVAVGDSDRAAFPELGAARYVLLIETDLGFVRVESIDTERHADRIREEYRGVE